VKVDVPHHCAFFEACAIEGTNGVFIPLADSRQEFPTRGSFRVVPDDLHIAMPEFGAIGFFEAEPDPNYDSSRGRSPSLFRAIAVLPDGIRLIVPFPRTSKESTEIGVELRKGLRVRHAVGVRPTVMLQLSDGVIAGPFTLKQVPNSALYQAEEQSLHQPKTAWSATTELPMVKVGSNSTIITVCAGKLPPPDRHVDFGPAELSLRKVLNELVEQGHLKADGLTKGKAQSLAIALSKLEPSEQIRARLEAVAGRINAAKEWDDSWNPFLEKLLDEPKVAAIIEAEKTAARKEASHALMTQQTAAKAAVMQAEHSLAQLTNAANAKKAELDDLQKQSVAAETQLADKIRSAANQIMNESEKLIAQAALLRPLLAGMGTQPTPEPRPAAASLGIKIAHMEQKDAAELVDDRGTLLALRHNLDAAGLSPAYTGELAATILGCIAAGLPLSVRGSLAGPLAKLILTSLFARRYFETEIPVGFPDLLTWNDWGLADPPPPNVGVLLAGANRSCLDAYASVVMQGSLARRVMFAGPRGPQFVLTLLEGPAALPIGPQHCALGPVIHTDALPWSRRASAAPRPGSWRGPSSAIASEAPADEIDELRGAIADYPNAAFEAGARELLPALAHYHALKEGGHPGRRDGLGALATWYLAPFLASQQAPADALTKFVPATPEKRVRDVLQRLLFRSDPT
jgi:hypothetical protein